MDETLHCFLDLVKRNNGHALDCEVAKRWWEKKFGKEIRGVDNDTRRRNKVKTADEKEVGGEKSNERCGDKCDVISVM